MFNFITILKMTWRAYSCCT